MFEISTCGPENLKNPQMAGRKKQLYFYLLFTKYEIIIFSLTIMIFEALLVNYVKNISLGAPD